MQASGSLAHALNVVSVVFLAVTLVAGPASASYLTWGADPGRTGVVDAPGPASLDTVLTVDLPGIRAVDAPPVVVGDSVFVLTRPRWFDFLNPAFDQNGSEAAVWRIDHATGELERFVDLSAAPPSPDALASDGQRLFLTTGGELHAYRVEDGLPAWSSPVSLNGLVTVEADVSNCQSPVVVDGVLYAACVAVYGEEEEPGTYLTGIQFAVAIDAVDGSVVWTWVRDEVRLDAITAYSDGYWAPRLAVDGGRVIVSTVEVDDVRGGTCADDPIPWIWRRAVVEALWGLDASTGDVLWASFPDMNEAWVFDTPDAIVATKAGLIEGTSNAPRGTFALRDDLLVFISRRMVHIEPATGCPVGDWVWLGDDAEVANTALDEAVVMVGDDLFIKARGQLGRYSVSNKDWAWRQISDWGSIEETGMLLAGGRMFSVRENGHLVYVDAATGETGPVVATGVGAPAVSNAPLHAITDDLLVVVSGSAQVTVLGWTAASIQLAPRLDLPDELPGTVTLDLSATQPGYASDATEFLVSWGDGTAVGWTTEPVLDHTYAGTGPFEATIRARNPAGQTSSTTVAVQGTSALGETSGLALGQAWLPVLGLMAIAGLVVAATTRRRLREHTRTVPDDRVETYRQALDHALADDGTLAEDRQALLAALRERLGITERDHAVMVRTILSDRTGAPAAVDVRPGETLLGKYAIERVLGEGGQGTTYLATDTVLERHVVVKLLHPGASDPTTILREARAMAAVEGDNVVSILEADQLGSRVFVVMEHMAGGSLDGHLASGPLDRDELARLARDLLAALAAVHAGGVVHRDVKPANVLLDAKGRAKLSDFGVVHVPGLEVTVAAFRTYEGAVGTIPYMAPEQARGHPAHAASDLYSAGLVLYEAATGERYHEQRRGESPVELQMRIASAGGFDQDLPTRLDVLHGWFARALHPDPARRFATADEMVAGFEEALG